MNQQSTPAPDRGKWAGIGGAVIFGILLFAQMFLDAAGSEMNVFALLGVLILTTIIGGIAYLMKWTRWPIFLLVLVALVLSGGQWVVDQFEVPIVENPPDNYYVWPEGGEVDQLTQDQREWVGEKYVPNLGEAGGKVWGAAWAVSIVAFVVMILLKGRIPLQVLFLVGWVAASIWLIASPLDKNPIDAQTAVGMDQIYWWGATQSIVWGIVTMGIPLLIQLVGGGAETLAQWVKHPLPILVYSALTWAAISLLFTVFDPGVITWRMGEVLVHETSLSATKAMECYFSGKIAFFAVSGAVRSLISILEQSVGAAEE